MRKIYLSRILASIIFSASCFAVMQAQVVKSLNYQGVVLDDEGVPIANETVSVTVSIPPSSVFTTTSAVTSSLGAFSVQIELPSDEKFDELVNYQVNTSVTTSKGTVTTTAPLSVVPMAIFAEKAAGIAGVDVLDESPTNEIQTLSIVGNALTISGPGGNTVNIPTGGGMGDGDNDPNNEIQTWDEVLGKPAGFADNIDNVDDADADPTNEIQSWSEIPGIPPAFVDGIDNVDDADADPENEIQTLSIDGATLTLSEGGGSVVIPTGGTDADADPTNELQTLDATNDGNNIELYLTDPAGNVQTVVVPDNKDDADADPENERQTLGSEEVGDTGLEVYLINNDGSTESTVFVPYEDDENELQMLTTPGDNGQPLIGIEDGNVIDLTDYLPDNSATNEIQQLALNGNALSISNGNQVDLGAVGGGSVWDETGNDIYYTGGNVGIGISDPSYPLEVGVNFSGPSAQIAGISIGTASPDCCVDYISSSANLGLNVSSSWISLFAEGSKSAEFRNSWIDLEKEVRVKDGLVIRSGFDDVISLGNSSSGSGLISIRNASETEIVRLGSGSGGALGVVTTYDSGNTPNVRMTTSSSGTGNGWMGVYDSSGSSQAGAFVNSSGQGVLFADVKNFVTDHPTRSGMSIVYASLEGPEAGAYERGTGVLVAGEAQILFSDHFSQIAIPSSMTVILTPLSADSEGMAVIEKTANGFKVKELRSGSGNYSFDWEVKCKRQGFEDYQVIRPTSDFDGVEPRGDDK